MNFLQKYNLAVTSRYGKGYVSVEDVGHVIHELEETTQFLKLRVNELEGSLSDKSSHLYDANLSIDNLHFELMNKQYNLTLETRLNLALAISNVFLVIAVSICIYKLFC